jgi:hypothetical protein
MRAAADPGGGAEGVRAYSDAVANRNVRDFGWGVKLTTPSATPADFPPHDCSPY